MPRVTVIIATYNWSTVLPYSIGSVLDQTLRDLEVLVVGDGCTDDSEGVVAAIGDERVRWINLPANFGHQSGPNNEGLRQARGDVIAYLGHDDLWMPHHLEVAVAALDGGGDVATGIVARVAPDGRILPLFLSPEVFGGWMPPTGIAHRKRMTDAIGGWRHHRELDIDPEEDLLKRARAAGYRFVSVPRITGVKFPAASRRDVYKLRPCHEQAQWLARIREEADLEQSLLTAWVFDGRRISTMRYRVLAGTFLRETLRRIRLRLRRWKRPHAGGAAIETRRKFKGLG